MKESIYNKFPVIELDRIILRDMRIDDVHDFLHYASAKEVKLYVSDIDWPQTIEEATKEYMYWASLYSTRSAIYWAIEHKKHKKLIGTCGFNYWNMHHHRGEISYDLSYEYWNKGYMTEAINAICDFAFERMDIHRLQATVLDFNIGSYRVLEKAGFKREGLLQGYGKVGGAFRDYYMYSKTRV